MSQVAGSLPCPLERLQPGLGTRSTPSPASLPPCDFAEASTWETLGGGWQCLYGCFCQSGVSVEWHEFECPAPREWSLTFHPDSIELCLNLSGHGRITSGLQTLVLGPMSAGFYRPAPGELSAWRLPGSAHQFLTIEFSSGFLQRHVQGQEAGLHPVIRHALRPQSTGPRLSEVQPLTPALRKWVEGLRLPALTGPALGLWYQAKSLEILAQFGYVAVTNADVSVRHPRRQRVARERVQHVIQVLSRDLSEPPSLEELGREVGCSPFHLSRTFSQEMGMTIPQYLRQIRMEKAAELLKSGKFNVTEAALEVGYSSVSHFSNAFRETLGCCPGLYPLGIPTPARPAR
jgi:AraC family transcriptional regulator